MADKKYQIFVSSTFRDLVEERQDAIRNILDLKHIPAGMELFPASDTDQLNYIKKVIDECDYYLLIVGGRYGSLDADGVSYTEREYDYAVERGKMVLAFVHSDSSNITLAKSDTSEAAQKSLKAFREKVMSGRLVKGWTSRENLEPLVLKALIHAFNDYPQVGWIRADTAATTEIVQQSNELLNENVKLKAELEELRKADTPRIEGLASLEESFNLRFRASKVYQGRTSYYQSSINLTWREIFLGVAGQLDKPTTDLAIRYGLRTAIKEKGFGGDLSSANDVDTQKIKIQLEALGLIQIYVSRTTQGGVAEFLKLTSRGRALFVDNMVVRSAT